MNPNPTTPKTIPTPSEEQELRDRLALRLSAKLVAHTPLGDTEILNAQSIVTHLMFDIEAYTNAKVNAVLDAIEESKPDFTKIDSYNRSFLQAMYKGTVDKAIQSQRNKLTNKKEGKS